MDASELGRLLSLSLNFEPLQKTLADLANRLAAAERVLPEKAEHAAVGLISDKHARVSGDLASQLASALARIRTLEEGAIASQRVAAEAETNMTRKIKEAEDRLTVRVQALEDDASRGRSLAAERDAAASARTTVLEGKVAALAAELAAVRTQAAADAKGAAEALATATAARDLSESTASRLGARVRALEEAAEAAKASQQASLAREGALTQRVSVAEEKLAAAAAAIAATRDAATTGLAALSESVDARLSALGSTAADASRRVSALDGDLLTLRRQIDRCGEGITAITRDIVPPVAAAARKADARVTEVEGSVAGVRGTLDTQGAEAALLKRRVDALAAALAASSGAPPPAPPPPPPTPAPGGGGIDPAQLAAMLATKADAAAFAALRARVNDMWKVLSALQAAQGATPPLSAPPAAAPAAQGIERGAFSGRQLLQVW